MTGIGRGGVSLDAINDIVVSGKIPTTAAGGGSNVNVTNVSGNVRVNIQGVNTTGSALDVNASFSGVTAAAVTAAGGVPLPVNVVQTSAQIHVTAGNAPVPVTIAAQPVAVSVNNSVLVSGQIKTTAVGAGGASVAITNVSGQIAVTAGNLKLPVSGHMRGQVETSAPADVNELAYADVRITSARAMHVAQQGAVVVSGEVSLRGTPSVNVVNVSGQVNVTATNNIGVSAAGTLNVSAGGAYLSAIDTATSGTRALTSAVMANTSAMRLDIDRVEALITASGLNVNATFGAAEVAVTAGASPLPVTVNAVGPLTDVCGVNRTGSALNTFLAGVSGQVQVTSPGGPLTDVCGVNRTGSALNTFLAGVSGQVQVTSPGGPLTDVCGVNRTGSALNTFLTGTSAQIHVTAGDLPVPVTQNAPGAWEIALRSDAVFNALVSNPVKFGKVAQVAGPVCADIVAAVASRRIRVLGGYFNSTGTATAIFMTTGASAALTPKIAVYGGFVLPITQYGYFETAVGSALTLQIENGSIGGVITYQEVV